jgi:hypothetical protein
MEAEGTVLDFNALTSRGKDSNPTIGFGKFNQTLVGNLTPRFYDLVVRGVVWSGCTAATGVDPGTSISTTSPFSLFNPPNSGVVAVPLVVTMSYRSGTMPAGEVVYAANLNPVAAAVSGTAIATSNALLATNAASPQGAKCSLLTTATLPTTPTLLRPFCSLSAIAAATAASPWLFKDEPEFVVGQGCTLSLMGDDNGQAGTSPLVIFGMSWAELPV